MNYPFSIELSAKQFADHDDCLEAAVSEVVSQYPDARGYDHEARYADDERETILVDVPAAVYAIWARAEGSTS